MQESANYKSPIGVITITGQDGYINSLYIGEESSITSKEIPAYLQQVISQLDEYFKGTRKIFDVPVKNDTTAFTKQVWETLTVIPYGKTYSYGEIAKRLGNAKASRAVGNACNRNPVPLIVPCHRVVGSNGAMTGFALGIQTKEWLLAHEARNLQAVA